MRDHYCLLKNVKKKNPVGRRCRFLPGFSKSSRRLSLTSRKLLRMRMTSTTKCGIGEAVTFEGKLPTHDDEISQIRKFRFALLPLKIDLTSGTIREAMANGLPVLTTDTGEMGTKKLNRKSQCALISSVGAHRAFAGSMIRLLKDNVLFESIKQNFYNLIESKKSNEIVAYEYVHEYKKCIEK